MATGFGQSNERGGISRPRFTRERRDTLVLPVQGITLKGDKRWAMYVKTISLLAMKNTNQLKFVICSYAEQNLGLSVRTDSPLVGGNESLELNGGSAHLVSFPG